MASYILAIDQGTTGTTSCLLDANAKMLAKANQEYEQIFPQPGWVEHNPEQIWQSVTNTIKAVLEKSRIRPQEIAAIGITNQRETVVLWDRQSHKPLHNAIVWQCRRTTAECEKLKKKGAGKFIRNKTGLVIDPYFSASKISWLLQNVPGARAKISKIAVGTIDSFLLWRLTAGKVHKTDVSNASRTQLMNIHRREWDKDLLKLFKVPIEILPELAASSGILGHTQGVAGLPDGIPIAGMAGDQQAALFGQACFTAGSAKCTFGTGSFLLMNTGAKAVPSRSGLLTTVAWQLQNENKLTYALEGGAFICGAAVQWLRDQLGLIQSSAEVEALARSVKSCDGVQLVPAFVGLGAPYWDPEARGIISGLTRGAGRAQIARATLEAMALQNVDILQAMQKDLKKRLRTVRVDGGATENNLLMQMQADFLGVNVQRPRVIETTVQGAAFLAGLGVGLWRDLKTLEKVWQMESEFCSALSSRDRDTRLKQWHGAIRQAQMNFKL